MPVSKIATLTTSSPFLNSSLDLQVQLRTEKVCGCFAFLLNLVIFLLVYILSGTHDFFELSQKRPSKLP
jgi:hypothetical protein